MSYSKQMSSIRADQLLLLTTPTGRHQLRPYATLAR